MRGDGGGDPGGRGGGPQLGRDDQVGLVGGLQGDRAASSSCRGRSTTTRSRPRRPASRVAAIASAGRPSGSPRSQESITRSPWPGRARTSDERVDPPVRAGEGGPAQPVELLPAEDQVEAAAERVAVDEQGAQPGAGGGDREAAGEHAGAGPAATAEHRDDAAGADVLGEALGEAVDQPGFGGGQDRDVFGADQLRDVPAGIGGAGEPDQDDPRPARAGGPAGTPAPGRCRRSPVGRPSSAVGRRPGRRRPRPRLPPAAASRSRSSRSSPSPVTTSGSGASGATEVRDGIAASSRFRQVGPHHRAVGGVRLAHRSAPLWTTRAAVDGGLARKSICYAPGPGGDRDPTTTGHPTTTATPVPGTGVAGVRLRGG